MQMRYNRSVSNVSLLSILFLLLTSTGYLTHHQLKFPPTHVLQSHADEYINTLTTAETLYTNLSSLSLPDEDGFTTVPRSRPGLASLPVAVEPSEKQKKKHAPVKDFYRFQMREERKKAQLDMMRRFEEDKSKVEDMKRRRRGLRPE